MIDFAVTPGDAPGLALRVLAILGGAFVAGILTGFVVKFLVRRLSSKPMPIWSVQIVRLLGAVVGGWLVSLWVLGGGGSGLGGSGGFGLGGGKDKGGTELVPSDKKVEEKDKKDPRKDADKGQPKETVVRIALLGSKPLEELFGKTYDISRCYRIEGEAPKAVFDLTELKAEVGRRREQASATTLLVVLYKDSPDEDNEFYKDLRRWLLDEKLYQEPEKVNRVAPR